MKSAKELMKNFKFVEFEEFYNYVNVFLNEDIWRIIYNYYAPKFKKNDICMLSYYEVILKNKSQYIIYFIVIYIINIIILIIQNGLFVCMHQNACENVNKLLLTITIKFLKYIQ